ncbi:serine hydrolase [Sphingosinithalassobacter sp. LHW66-3]|uniref:serine hydrolase n=1 Tax=Sphingosinithalassobacter sp. LHW66-3 TaxID=3424718 RepID=UPI003D6AF4B3
MKRLILLCLCFAASPALADPPAGFEARVEALRQQLDVPGVAIAIVEDGETVLARGWGVRAAGGNEPVTADTLFLIGSASKAFTAAALATLVDEGRLDWDDPVIEHFPEFQMYDPWVTREITVRDLLVHRSGLGLGAGDLLFVPRSNIPRAEAVRRLRHIAPATSFRSGYAYDNVLYMVAGQLIEEVTGQRWEDYVVEHLLRPAGMLRSTSNEPARLATPDRAQAHARLGGPIRGIGTLRILDERESLAPSSAPAGGIASSANELAQWLKIQLAHGALPNGEGRVFSEEAGREMWDPVVLLPTRSSSGPMAVLDPMFSTYALGWSVQEYRGAKIVSHGGAVFGSLTMVAMIPEENVGFSITVNSEEGELVRGLFYELLDHYLDKPRGDWPEKLAEMKQQRIAAAVAQLESAEAQPAEVGPSLALDRYAGTYSDAWYGDIEVARSGDGLTIDFKSTPNMGGRLEHWQYDTFVTRFTDPGIEPAYVTFALDADGKVERVTMKPVSPLADFSWDYQHLLFRPAAE